MKILISTLLAAAIGAAFVMGRTNPPPAGAEDPAPTMYLKYERTIAILGRPIDGIARPPNSKSIYLLSEEKGLYRYDLSSGEGGLFAGIPGALAAAYDSSTDSFYVIGPTQTRGPWHFIYKLDGETGAITSKQTIDDLLGFNLQNLGLAVDARGRVYVNDLYSDGPRLVSFEVDGRRRSVSEFSPDLIDDAPAGPEVLRAAFRQARVKTLNNLVVNANLTTGTIVGLDANSGQSVFSFAVGEPRTPEIVEGTSFAGAEAVSNEPLVQSDPPATDVGNVGVKVSNAIHDIHVTANADIWVLLNGMNDQPIGKVIDRFGRERYTIRFSSQNPPGVLPVWSYTNLLVLSPSEVVLLNAQANRVDLFSLATN